MDKNHPKVHSQIVRFKLAIDEDNKSISPKALEVIKSEFSLLPSSTDLTKYNDDFLSKNKDSAKSVLSALETRKLLSKESVDKDVVAILELPSITFEEAEEVLDLLITWKSGKVEEFKKKAAAKWPKATAFST